MKLFKSRKFIFTTAFVALIAGGIFAPFYSAQASIIEKIAASTIYPIIGAFVSLLSGIVSYTLLPIAAMLLNWVFFAGKFVQNPLVLTGWTIARDLANMFFILVLVFVGLATVIQVGGLVKYQFKKIIPKLILVALLINFSLVIGGVFIDIGNDLGKFFVTGGDVSRTDTFVGDNIVAALKLTTTFETPENPEVAGAETNILIRHVMSFVFVLVATFLLFAMALIMIFRIIYLWLLLILAPLAWTASILPDTQRWWSSWWDNFLKWALFPAVFGFFIYIALVLGLSFNEVALQDGLFGGGPVTPDELTQRGTVPFSSLIVFLQYLLVIFVLFYGTSVAVSWSAQGAKTGMAWANKAKDWTLGKVKDQSTKYGSRLARGALYKKEGDKFVPRDSTKFLAATPFARYALRPTANLAEKTKGLVSEAEGKYGKLSTNHLKTIRSGLNREEKIAVDRILASRGDLKADGDFLSEKDIADSMKAAASAGLDKEMILAAPDIALKHKVREEFEITDMIIKARPDSIEKMSDGALGRMKGQMSTGDYNAFMGNLLNKWRGAHVGKAAEKLQYDNLNEIESYVYETFKVTNPATGAVTPQTRDYYLDKVRDVLGNPALTKYLRESPAGQELFNNPTYVTP